MSDNTKKNYLSDVEKAFEDIIDTCPTLVDLGNALNAFFIAIQMLVNWMLEIIRRILADIKSFA